MLRHASEPALLIADEPTTGLDVTIQAQVLELLDRLRQRLHMGLLLVTHDLGVIAGHADRVLVMYAGRIVEAATTTALFARPRHPYTEALLEAVPRLDGDTTQPLRGIPGLPPDLSAPPRHCLFQPRCRYATPQCATEEPVLDGDEPGRSYACFHPVGLAGGERGGVRTRTTIATSVATPVPMLIALPITLPVLMPVGLTSRAAEDVRPRVSLARAASDVQPPPCKPIMSSPTCSSRTMCR